MTATPAKPARKSVPAMLADTDYLFRLAKQGAAPFCDAAPFPHRIAHPFIKPACGPALYEALAMPGMPAVLRLMHWELSSSTLLRHFSTLTDLPPLLPDPFFVNSGSQLFSEPATEHRSRREYLPRHPQTDLLNVLRVELFVSPQPDAHFSLDVLDADGAVVATHEVANAGALFVLSDHYAFVCRMAQPERWRSLLAWYYINDRARITDAQESGHGAY